MIYSRNDSGYTYSFGDYSLYLGASAGTTGNNDNVTAKYSGSDGPIQSGSSDSAWSANDIPIGTTSTITYTIPTYYTADFTSTGINVTGSSISGKTVTVSGVVTGDVAYGFENYRQNIFSASASAVEFKLYGDSSLHPAYAFAYEFGSANPAYNLYSGMTPVTVRDAWYNYNGTVYYDEISSADVELRPYGVFKSAVKDAYINLSLTMAYSAGKYTGTPWDGIQVRMCMKENGGDAGSYDWFHLVSTNFTDPFNRTHTFTASANISAWNPVQWLGGWIEQCTFSSKYDLVGSLSGHAFVSGIIP